LIINNDNNNDDLLMITWRSIILVFENSIVEIDYTNYLTKRRNS